METLLEKKTLSTSQDNERQRGRRRRKRRRRKRRQSRQQWAGGAVFRNTHPGWASFRGSVQCRFGGVWGRGAICGPNSDCRGEAVCQCSPQCCESLSEEEEQTPHRVINTERAVPHRRGGGGGGGCRSDSLSRATGSTNAALVGGSALLLSIIILRAMIQRQTVLWFQQCFKKLGTCVFNV